MRRTSRPLAAAAAAVSAVLLAGCGVVEAFGETQDPRERVTTAIEQTWDATSRASLEMDMTMSGEAIEVTAEMDGEGVMDAPNERGEMSMTVTMSGTDTPAETTGMTMVLDGGTVYMQDGADPGQWVRSDASGTPGAGWTGALALGMVPEEVTEVGEDEVRGEAATRYRYEAPMAEVLEETMPSMGDLPAGALDMMEDMMDTTVPVEVWIGDEDRVRRSSTEMTVSMDDLGLSMDMHMTMEMWDFGTEVSVEIPPEDQVVDAPAGGAPGFGGTDTEPPGTEGPSGVGGEQEAEDQAGAGADQGASGWEARLPACEALTGAEVEQATGLPVEAEEITPDNCRYRTAGTSSATVPLARLDLRRYPGGTSVEDYRETAETFFEDHTDFWPDTARQPIDGLGQTAEGLVYELGVYVLVYIDDTIIVLNLQADEGQEPETTLDTAVGLASVAVERLQ